MNMYNFHFENGYNFSEYKEMCNCFKGLKLSGIGKMKINLLLADYIFCIATNRIHVDKVSRVKRILALMFNYSLKKEKIGSGGATAFVFSGDAQLRPDYLNCLHHVISECKDASLFLLDRSSRKFSIRNFLFMPVIFCWTKQIYQITKKWSLSIDMAVAIFRSYRAAKKILKEIEKKGYKKIITFCDQWGTENALTQIAKTKKYQTATLQHGNGNEIFAGFCSDMYLCNSLFSKKNAVKCGIPEKQLYIAGPMKYAGFSYHFPEKNLFEKIGVVFDGLDNFKNNIVMLEAAHQLSEDYGIKCFIRFHPSNKREEYKKFLQKTDVICETLEEFESIPDFYMVYSSTMYTELIYKKKVVFRYSTSRINMFSDLHDMNFENYNTLQKLVTNSRVKYAECIKKLDNIYAEMYGFNRELHSYKEFFKEW